MPPKTKLPDDPIFASPADICKFVNILNGGTGQAFKRVPSRSDEIHLACVKANCPCSVMYASRINQAAGNHWGRSKTHKILSHDHTRAGQADTRSFLIAPEVDSNQSSPNHGAPSGSVIHNASGIEKRRSHLADAENDAGSTSQRKKVKAEGSERAKGKKPAQASESSLVIIIGIEMLRIDWYLTCSE